MRGAAVNNYIIEKLKEGRANAKLKQSEVAEKIGIKGNTLSNYENGVSEPDIDTFCALCDIYNIDPADILNEAYCLGVQGESFKIRPSEIEHVKKYRDLDPHGKKMVDFTLQEEWERSTAAQQLESNVVPMAVREDTPDYLTVQAAHNDVEITDEELEKMQRDINLMKQMKERKK